MVFVGGLPGDKFDEIMDGGVVEAGLVLAADRLDVFHGEVTALQFKILMFIIFIQV